MFIIGRGLEEFDTQFYSLATLNKTEASHLKMRSYNSELSKIRAADLKNVGIRVELPNKAYVIVVRVCPIRRLII